MVSSATHLRPSLAGLLALALLVVACGGGESRETGSDQSLLDDPASEPDQSVVTPGSGGFPLADGTAAYNVLPTEHTLSEDSQLNAPLSLSSDVSPRFSLLRSASFGEIRLTEDRRFIYTPQADFHGDDAFQVYAWSADAGTAPVTIKLRVTPVPDRPILQADVIPVIEQDREYRAEFLAADADGDVLVFAGDNLPDWLTLDPETGVLAGLPTQSDVGIHTDMVVRVVDETGLTAAIGPFSIEVIDINDAPTINPAQFPRRMDARERVMVSVFPDDPDGDKVTVTTEPNDFVDVEVRGGLLDVTASDVVEVTRINLVVIAEDRRGSVSRAIIPITLYPLTESGRGRTVVGRKYGAGVHLVVLGDGYKNDELAKFERDVWRLVSLMQSDPAVRVHFDAWNIHVLPIASVDSGIDDNILEDFRDTEYNAGFYCASIPRLICADQARVFDNALHEFPQLHQVVLLVNDPRYGGSGGAVAIASTSALEITLHELGHSVAQLADEYVDGLVLQSDPVHFTEGDFANVSYHNTPEQVPWSHWIDDVNQYPTEPGQAGVGIFTGALYRETGVYRPTDNSRMRSNQATFGPVNGEQWALSVYRIAHPIRDFGPVVDRVDSQLGESLHFFVAPLFGPELQQVVWEFNGEPVQTGANQNLIDLQPSRGVHQLTLRVDDRSSVIRKPPPHAASFQWHWEIQVR